MFMSQQSQLRYVALIRRPHRVDGGIHRILQRVKRMRLFQHGFNLRRSSIGSMFLAFALVLSGCAGSGPKNVAYAPANFGAPDLETIAAISGDARISPLDKLEIKVFQVADLSGNIR
jgi:hypothetical protein